MPPRATKKRPAAGDAGNIVSPPQNKKTRSSSDLLAEGQMNSMTAAQAHKFIPKAVAEYVREAKVGELL
jgi:hypothetical protein